MGFYQPKEDDWLRTTSRVLIHGAPNSGKTRSLATWPYSEEEQLVIISFPGEMGANSLPRGPGIKTFVWQATPEEKLSSATVVEQVYKLTVEILSGKHGKVKTFAGDGIHQLADYYLDAASNGEHFAGKDFTIEKQYGKQGPHVKCYAKFMEYLKLVYFSPIPFVVFTSWHGREPGEYGGVKVESGRVYPGLPGKLAERVMGLFSLVLYAEAKQNIVKRITEYTWQPKESKEIGGAAAKLPDEVLARIPEKVPQDWGKLYSLIKGE